MINLTKDPLPPGLDLAARVAVRRWICAMVEVEVTNSGRVTPQLRIFFEDKLVSAPLGGLFDVGQEHQAAAYWHALGSLDGARRRFRVATVLLGPEGAARTAAVAMEWEHHLDRTLKVGDELPAGLPGFGARWWLAYRFYGEGGGGTGVLHGDWVEREGTGFEGLDEPFRELLDAGKVGVTLPPLEWEQDASVLDHRDERPLRESVRDLRAPRHHEADRVGVGEHREVPQYIVQPAREPSTDARPFDRVAVEGEDPEPIDPLAQRLRLRERDHVAEELSGRSRLPAARSPHYPLRDHLRPSPRAQRALVLDFGPDGRPIPIGEMTQDPVEVPPAERWIGVAPSHDMQIKNEGMMLRGKGGVERPVPEG